MYYNLSRTNQWRIQHNTPLLHTKWLYFIFISRFIVLFTVRCIAFTNYPPSELKLHKKKRIKCNEMLSYSFGYSPETYLLTPYLTADVTLSSQLIEVWIYFSLKATTTFSQVKNFSIFDGILSCEWLKRLIGRISFK